MLRPVKPGNNKRKPSRQSGSAFGHKGKHGMRPAITIGFTILALLSVGFIFQAPSALADDSANPFTALWNAILNLQSRDDDLQSQIDELKANRGAQLPVQEPKFISDAYAEINIEADDEYTLVYIKAGNSGPDKADEVKVTAFYLMPLFEINSVDSNCETKSRGIIECTIGTLEVNQETIITIGATAKQSGEGNTWTVDILSTTDDSDYSNNHVTYNFETGSGELILDVERPVLETIEPEQSDQPTPVTEEPQATADNQTSIEPNETSAENQTSTVTEDSGTNSTSAEQGSENSEPEESVSEPSAEESEESTESEAPVEEQSEEDQGTFEESSADETTEQGTSGEESSEENTQDSSGDEEETAESGESTEGEETRSP